MSKIPLKFNAKIIVSSSIKPEEGAVWMFYPMGRYQFIIENQDLYEGQTGTVIPTFGEECHGRHMLAYFCENLAKQAKPVPSAYLADLLRVHNAGYLREYVWWFLGQPSWRTDQQPPELLSFMAWVQRNLRNHIVETHGGVEIYPINAGTDPGKLDDALKADRRPADVYLGGGSDLKSSIGAIEQAHKNGNMDEANRLLQIFSVAAEKLQNEADARYVCFQTDQQVNFRQAHYFVSKHPELKKVIVLDWCVAVGTFFRAFFLSHSRRFAEALLEVEKLTKLAPLFPKSYIEKGYILNNLRRPNEALMAYNYAWELCARFPENLSYAAAALRGRAVTLAELGDLGGAEKLLHDSLVLEPESALAKNELNYIRVRRGG